MVAPTTSVARYPEGVEAIWLATSLSRVLDLGVHVFRAGPWLIDAGFKHAGDRLRRWPGLDGAEACLLTHHHEDHVGNAALIADRDIPVLTLPRVVPYLEDYEHLGLYRRAIWGTPTIGRVEALDGPVELEGWRLVPIHTPGHSPDHFVYHEPQRQIVFTGDLYIGSQVQVAKPDENIGKLVRSLKRVRALAPRTLFCGHRGRLDDPAAALSRKIDWLEELIDRARTLADRGLDLAAITRQLLGREGFIYWFTGREFSKRNLIRAALDAANPRPAS